MHVSRSSATSRRAVKEHTGGMFWFGAIAYVLSSILDKFRVLRAGLRKDVATSVCIVAEQVPISNSTTPKISIHDRLSPHDVRSGDERQW